MKVDDDLHAEGGVVLRLDAKKVEEKGHEVRGMLAQRLDMRQSV